MQRTLHSIIFSAFLLGLLPGLMSCRQKDILFPEAGMAVLDVRFEWPGSLVDPPHGMTLWFFPLNEEGRIWRFDIAGHQGGPVEIPYGEYTLVSYNNDVASIRIKDPSAPENIAAILSESEDRTPELPQTTSQGIKPLYRARIENIEFTPAGVRWKEEGTVSELKGRFPTISCHPSKISTTYILQVEDIEGLERVQKGDFRFHGVCDTLLLWDGQSRGTVLDITSGFEIPESGKDISSTFESFGPLTDVAEGSLEIIITLKDRQTYRKTIDIAEQLTNRQDSFFVKIVIKGFSIPNVGEPPNDDVGMVVDVDGWTIVDIDYTTGP